MNSALLFTKQDLITFKASDVQSDTIQPFSGVEKGHPPFEMWRYQ